MKLAAALMADDTSHFRNYGTAAGDERRCAPPPAEELGPALWAHLQHAFNPSQCDTIRWAASHFSSACTAADVPFTLVQVCAALCVSMRLRGAAHNGSNSPKGECMDWACGQGPPGTGKTHTVWGLLNVLHFVQFQRYYASLLKVLAPDSVQLVTNTVTVDSPRCAHTH
jgi:hypothetical protein